MADRFFPCHRLWSRVASPPPVTRPTTAPSFGPRWHARNSTPCWLSPPPSSRCPRRLWPGGSVPFWATSPSPRPDNARSIPRWAYRDCESRLQHTPSCRSTLKCNDDRKRQKVLCISKRATRRNPRNIASRSRYCSWFNREKPAYTARIMVSSQDHGEEKAARAHSPGHPVALQVDGGADGGADQFAELQFLEHHRQRKQYTVCRQGPACETTLCRGTELLGSRDCSPRACSAAPTLTASRSVFTNRADPFQTAPR